MQVDEAPLQPVEKTKKRKKLKKYKKQKKQISRKMKKLKNHKKQKIENYKKALLFQFLVLVDWWNFRYDLCAPKVASRRGVQRKPPLKYSKTLQLSTNTHLKIQQLSTHLYKG